jgi:protein SCO1/2
MHTYQKILIASALFVSACSGAGDDSAVSGKDARADQDTGQVARSGGPAAGCKSRAYEEIGGPLELTMHTGERVTEEDFKGRPSLVYFGFTYCPDICPGTLVAIENAYKRLPDDMEPPRTILISVDPERDTPEALAAYVESNAFPDDLVGLTGSDDEIRAVSNAFSAGYARVETPESVADYTMDHTSLIYVMGADWKLKTFFAESINNPDDIAQCLASVLEPAD